MPEHVVHSQYAEVLAATAGEFLHLEARIVNLRNGVLRDANLTLSAAVLRLTGALALTADALDELFPDDPNPEMQNDLRSLMRAEEANMQAVRSMLRV